MAAGFLTRLLTITLEDYVYLFVAAAIVVSAGGYVLLSNPAFDAQYRFAVREGLDAFGDGKDAELTFTREQVELVNSVSRTSIGPESVAVGDERLFCMKVSDGVVTELRFVDNVSTSTETSVSGSCTTVLSSTGFDGFLHTQPGYSSQLSEEDKALESPNLDYTCIAFDRIVQVQEEVGGLNCWNITGSEESGFNFTQIEVGIGSRPELLPS